MPELHSNQIQFQAPEPTHVNLAAKENDRILAQQLGALGDAFGKLEDTISRINDVEFAENIKTQAALGLKEIDESQNSDDNYETERRNLLDRIQATMASAPEDVRTRFMRNNPNYMDNLWLSADEKIFKKVQDHQITRAKLLVPQLASNVTQGVSDFDTEYNKLQEIVAGMDNSVADEMLFNFRDEIARANITTLINNHKFNDARDAVRNPAITETLTPTERVRYESIINNTQAAVLEQYYKEAQALLKETQKTDGEAVETIVEQGATILEGDLKNETFNVNKWLEAMDTGNDVYIEGIGWVNASGIPLTQRNAASKKVRALADDSVAFNKQATAANKKAENLQLVHSNAVTDGSPDRFDTYSQMIEFRNSDAAYGLSKENLDKIDGAIQDEINSSIEAAVPSRYVPDQEVVLDYIFSNPNAVKTLSNSSMNANAIVDSLKKAANAYGKTPTTAKELEDMLNANNPESKRAKELLQNEGVTGGPTGWLSRVSALISETIGIIPRGLTAEYSELNPLRAIYKSSFDQPALRTTDGIVVPLPGRNPANHPETPAGAYYADRATLLDTSLQNYVQKQLNGNKPKSGSAALYVLHLTETMLSAAIQPDNDPDRENIFNSLGVSSAITASDVMDARIRLLGDLVRSNKYEKVITESPDDQKLLQELTNKFYSYLQVGDDAASLSDEQLINRALVMRANVLSARGYGGSRNNIVEPGGSIHQQDREQYYGNATLGKKQLSDAKALVKKYGVK